MGIAEPLISREEVLVLPDKEFDRANVCIVTGAATGIGRAVAIAAALNNLTVVGLDVNAQGGKETRKMVEDMGGRMVFVATDLSRGEDIRHAVTEAAKLGELKYLANIAGLQHIDSIDHFPMEKYDLMQKVMVRAPFYLSQLVIPHMKKSKSCTGVIGNMASVHAYICTLNKPAHNITQFSLRALTQSISAEGEGKIRSFSVSTGFVKTSHALRQIPAQAEQRGISPEEVVSDVMMGKSLVKEMMAPVDVANLFMFGFSRYAKYLVGGDLLFDGGMVLTY